MLADVAEQAGLDLTRCETPCPVMKLESVDVAAGHDRLQRQARQLLVDGEIADRTGGRHGGNVDEHVRDRMPGPGRVIDMVLEVVAQELSDAVASFHDRTGDVELGSRQQLGIRIDLPVVEVVDIFGVSSGTGRNDTLSVMA